MKIVVDCMGGDNGSTVVIEAIKEFLGSGKHAKKDVEIIAVGDEKELEPLKDVCKIVPSYSIVPMDAHALDVMRMKDSSMLIALNTLMSENADAVVSCGSTGGFLSAATLICKLIPGIKRAALVAPFPTKIKDKKVCILDVGANNENSPEELFQFGYMGRAYAQAVYGIEEPNVCLLNNGIEEGKGSPTVNAAYKLFKESDFPGFMGNIEARNTLDGFADVIVCDGFSGNVLLKSTEGTALFFNDEIKHFFKKNFLTKFGYLFERKGVHELREKVDYKGTGGAMLLGVNKVVVKAHGNSDTYS
ncbi:MAG: phosphate acyltransferase PlsX, partial [Coprobacillus sp.]|nr:phosphate acyltransferase PlsX [Coprobacillus sp.]